MPSKHPRLNTLPADLFAGLQSFRELEARIAGFPEGSLLRGDALEVFVEAHLQNSPLFQVEEVWLVGQIPHGVRQQLGLGNNHKGIDGVYQTSDGTLVPYQVKFREGRPQVGVGDTSSFFMLTEGLAQRALISNSDRYSNDVRDRQNLQIISGLYFDALSAEDFARIDSWLKDRPAVGRRERPMRRHQERAVAALVNELHSETRATAVMPCGTGKTLVALRAVEELKPRSVVVLVPSLALLAQLLEDWARDTVWGKRFRYLCVCSEPAISAEVDRWEMDPKDVPFEVKTDPSVVRSFLEHGSDRDIIRVVFSTYHSADKVAEGLPAGFRFDVGVFDEAHKTTEGRFGLALKDENLPIDRRLFLTATPRHIDAKRRNKEGDFNIVSMDNAAVYGRQAFRQPFGEAVVDEIICDYRVVVSVVDRSEISEHAERYGITLVQNDPKQFKWVATQIAVTKALEETGATKVITFHTDRKQAKHFASSTSHGIKQFLPDFELGYVDGKQPVADRKDNLRCLYGRGKGLVSNAKCLTEGVDLPALDAVVFNNPRRSKVDIVQAVGRAIRKPPNSDKQFGYVVIPVLLERSQTDDLEEACRGTEWEDLVAVIAALRDQDPRLEEIICEAQEAAGRGEVFDPRPFGEKITILGRPEVSLDTIQRHISAVVLERLGEAWDYRYGQLVAHRNKNGRCNVSPDENKPLSDWVSRQRQQKRRKQLSRTRVEKLNVLGFIWDPFDAQWDERCGELETYHAKKGHCDLPWNYHDSGLYAWVSNQRTARKEGRLSQDQITRLDRIGFDWDPFGDSFEEFLGQLEQYKRQHGDCSVPARTKGLGQKLARQRTLFRLKQLPKDRYDRLVALGVVFDPFAERFETMFARLARHHELHGNCNVSNETEGNADLLKWMSHIRTRKKQRKLTADQTARFDALGFLWSPKKAAEALWKQRVEELKAYIAKHGDSNVPLVYPENQEFANWWKNTRSSRNRGKLNKLKERELDALGVTWSNDDSKWNSMFEQLKLYKEEFGHCKVPLNYADNPKLGRWVGTQLYERRKKIKRRNTAERVRKLASIGFWTDWNLT